MTNPLFQFFLATSHANANQAPIAIAWISSLSAVGAFITVLVVLYKSRAERKKIIAEAQQAAANAKKAHAEAGKADAETEKIEVDNHFAGGIFVQQMSEAAVKLVESLSKANAALQNELAQHEQRIELLEESRDKAREERDEVKRQLQQERHEAKLAKAELNAKLNRMARENAQKIVELEGQIRRLQQGL